MRIVILLMLFSTFSWGLEKASVDRGRKIYTTVCFACHGANLEGSTGFNLKDAEWIHGDKPEQILASIKKGFPEKGMIPFATVYKDEQLQDVVNFIIAKQEGLRDLSYNIYHGLNGSQKITSIDWQGLKANKNGKITPSYIDFNVPEVDEFGMSYNGTLLIPEGGKYQLKGSLHQKSHLQVFINGKELKIDNYFLNATLDLKPGKQQFSIRYVKLLNDARFNLVLSKKGITIPLSIGSFNKINNKKHIVAALLEPVVTRKRITGLPSRSIAVAFKEGVNYSFNPMNGSINGFWTGAFLDIAPNINGRGTSGSKILGKYVFNGDQGIDLLVDGKASPIKYIKYSTSKEPEFFFSTDKLKVAISAVAQSQGLVFTYKVSGLSGQSISLKIPSTAKITSKNGTLDSGILKINKSASANFSFILAR